jgi:alpha-L-fucosidase
MTRDERNRELAEAMRHNRESYWNLGRYRTLPVEATRERRLGWWRKARLGMFIHWGLYSLLGRHEWAMNAERIGREEYEALADRWTPKPGAAKAWAVAARNAGMNYMVFTAKHHDGFCLWDTEQTDFNSVRRGPERDLVAEYVEAARQAGLKVGLYYSLMDWHHPDGFACRTDQDARERFVGFTHACVEELCTRHGPLDILWYDVPAPLTPEQWRAEELNAKVRQWQGGILINDRTGLMEDFATPEEGVVVAEPGRDWEVAMTMNRAWGYVPSADADYRSVREILEVLAQAGAHGGNLLLNVGPLPDGSVPQVASERLVKLGRWLRRNGEAVFGNLDRQEGRFQGLPRLGRWTLRGRTAYYWCHWWPGRELTIGGIRAKLLEASLLADHRPIEFEQSGNRIVLRGLPKRCPDPIAGIAVIQMEFKTRPKQDLPYAPD